MEVHLTPDQKAFVRQALESGRLLSEAEILIAVDEAEASLARGEGRPISQDSMRDLAEDVKRRGHLRLAVPPPMPR